MKYLKLVIIAVLVYANIGYLIGYLISLQQIKQEKFKTICETKNKNACVKFVLTPQTKANISFELWSQTEFEYHGKMYDIVFTEHLNGIRVLYALADDLESNFIENFKNYMSQSLNGKHAQLHYFQFISDFDNDDLLCFIQFNFFKLINLSLSNDVCFHLQNYYVNILKPPTTI